MIELGLQRISRLLANTPLKWRAIHVAGTNGKGSVCAYASGMLEAYNKSDLRAERNDNVIRHGRFTSPHLVDRWDCITVNQKVVTYSLFREIEAAVLERDRREAIGATQFELLTATAFEIFNKENVDVGVVEVGLGGRLDATNILGQKDGVDRDGLQSFRPLPLVTAISSIGLDHQDMLGSTLEKIAKEKAGIIKRGVPVVYSYSNDPEAIKVIRQVAIDNESPLGTPRFRRVESLDHSSLERKFALMNELKSYGRSLSAVSNKPLHVQDNLALAIYAVWIALKRLGRLPFTAVFERSSLPRSRRPNSAIAKTLGQETLDMLAVEMARVNQTTQFPGRQQKISIEPLTGRKKVVLLDGAHNAQSAKALASTVDSLASNRANPATKPTENISPNGKPQDVLRSKIAGYKERKAVTWVLATSSSKDAKDILSPLLKDGDAVFAVEFEPVDGMPWVKPSSTTDLIDVARTVVSDPDSIYVHDCGSDVLSALKAASRHADGGPLVIAGSLYLVGDVLRLLRDTGQNAAF